MKEAAPLKEAAGRSRGRAAVGRRRLPPANWPKREPPPPRDQEKGPKTCRATLGGTMALDPSVEREERGRRRSTMRGEGGGSFRTMVRS